jgi:hypothetical protein
MPRVVPIPPRASAGIAPSELASARRTPESARSTLTLGVVGLQPFELLGQLAYAVIGVSRSVMALLSSPPAQMIGKAPMGRIPPRAGLPAPSSVLSFGVSRRQTSVRTGGPTLASHPGAPHVPAGLGPCPTGSRSGLLVIEGGGTDARLCASMRVVVATLSTSILIS